MKWKHSALNAFNLICAVQCETKRRGDSTFVPHGIFSMHFNAHRFPPFNYLLHPLFILLSRVHRSAIKPFNYMHVWQPRGMTPSSPRSALGGL